MNQDRKYTIEILVAMLFHPLAVILTWINLAQRTDVGPKLRAFWGFFSLVWIVGPLSYIYLGGGRFW